MGFSAIKLMTRSQQLIRPASFISKGYQSEEPTNAHVKYL